jgi:hypothetical protein
MGFWMRIKAFGPWSRARRERDLEREIRNHVEIETEESGKHTAQRLFGNDALVREDVRSAWGWTRFEQFWTDVCYGLRQLRRSPAFSAIAITTLALGIGVNTAIFSAIDAVLIRPLPFTDADRLVMIWDALSNIGFPKHLSTPAEWREWRRSNTVFTDIADTESGPATLSGEGEPEQVPGRKVTGNLWSVLGVRPLLGRVFTEEEELSATSQDTGALERVPAAGVRARISRVVWSALLWRRATHKRNWSSHGIGRHQQSNPAVLRRSRPGADDRWTRDRVRTVGDLRAPDNYAAVWLSARLCADCRRGIGCSTIGGDPGVFYSRPPRVAYRSDRRAAA